MLPRCALIVFAVYALLPSSAWPDAEQDWQTIIAQESGPQNAEWRSRDQARSAALGHLNQQEKTLRNFVTKYPGDPRRLDAQLRLAHLLAIRADLEGNEKARAESTGILTQLASDPGTPRDRRADVEFAKLSLFMRRVGSSSDATAVRQPLMEKAQAFQKAFPDDRRIAPLLVEIATLFDSEPQKKKALLEQAQMLPADEETKQRIGDDLKRVGMLGQPVSMQWTSLGGQTVDLSQLRGKVVLIYFFADWSPPSMTSLDWVRNLAARNLTRDVKVLGISLDENRDTLTAALAAHKVAWPVYFDGKSWESPLVRSLGINSLPTLWIVDRRGNLRALNARSEREAAGTIAQLLHER